tara:strand:- start:3 stop:728 length:726 start_codon:yes stop_codon:yes gene_type:complete
MNVDIVDKLGDDLTVVNAARVSFDKESSWEHLGTREMGVTGRLSSLDLKEKDKKLLEYLAKHQHWSPFSHVQLQFRIKAPLFVARQLGKHQVGLAWNEVSRRYVSSEPEFYTPDVWRGVAEDKKQGSSDKEIDINPVHPNGLRPFSNDYELALIKAKWTYETLLRRGVCPEQARMVLPQSTYTEWYWTGSLYAFARICKLRMADDTQKETRFIAESIDKHCKYLYPNSWMALMREYSDEQE